LLALAGDRSLLRATLARVGDRTAFAPPLLIGSGALAEALAAEAAGAGARLVLEPCGRSTAPALAVAALLAESPDRLLLVMPSDHLIRDGARFLAAVEAAAPLARDGWLTTFGIPPTRAETGYGYIRRGPALGECAFEAAEFVEKPDLLTAQAYLDSGDFDWNSGIFLLTAARCLEELRRHRPTLLEAAAQALAGADRNGDRISLEAESFARCESVSIDVAVMEQAERIAMVPVEMGWSDLGSWDSVYQAGPADDAGNVLHGAADATGARNCLVHSDGPRIVALNVEDLIIVATAEGVLVTRRNGP
jgi:mannose-1-phosphate guanylyltransferase/mannose-1-phosphate guanylyltransferase/mannose-6-phosphate isomerase